MDPQDRVLMAMVAAVLGLTLVLIAIGMGDAALGLSLAFIAIAMAEAALERERQKTRQMEQSLSDLQAALQVKEREHAMLMTKRKEMLAEEAANQKLVDDFMDFIDDPEIAQNFDEKEMMNTILHRMKNRAGNNAPENGANPGEEATMAADEGEGESSDRNGI